MKRLLFLALAVVLTKLPEASANTIKLKLDQVPEIDYGAEAILFLGDALGNQMRYAGDRKILSLQTFFMAGAVYTAIKLDALAPDYFVETWLVKSLRENGRCIAIEGTINADDDLSGGGGVSVHN